MSAVTLQRWLEAISSAELRIRPWIRHTPLEHSKVLSDKHVANVYIKLESEQVTGSFKIRGVFNKLLQLREDNLVMLNKGSIVASTGNHALAFNYALKRLGLAGKTYVTETISPVKEASLRGVGAELIKYGQDCVDCETAARNAATVEGCCYISPYNDNGVIAGQGTIGVEVYKDLQGVDAVFVPVGGGGLISGIGAYLKAVKPNVQIIGCQPVLSKVMYECVKVGRIIFEESKPTLSDGTSGGVEEESVTFDLCHDLVDDWVLVEEDEIANAILFMIEHHHKIVEGAAGVSLAAFMKQASKYKNANVVIIASGANIGIDVLKGILNRK